jgi:DNA-binding LytR/AlgR family response regulator
VPAAQPHQVAPPAFATKLRKVSGTGIVAVEAEDHFIRVHGPEMSELVYCQFGEAVTDLARLDGLRVHRSWWVARAAIAGAVRINGNPGLRLVNGTQVPVGRQYLADVRAVLAMPRSAGGVAMDTPSQ